MAFELPTLPLVLAALLISLAGYGQEMSPKTVSEVNALRAETLAASGQPLRMTLDPARWIWMPCKRTLSNTFVLFRKEVVLEEMPVRARGWITADSRYRLTVNGKRVQWGPAPCDPRQLDVDPCDFTALLQPGKNVLGAEVLFYGLGDGTWPAGKPGFIFNASLDYADGHSETIVSDSSWQALPDRAHQPGQYKRWYLRALQETYDARLHPMGWDTPEYVPDASWVAAGVLDCAPDKPAACGHHDGNDLVDRLDPAVSALRARQIPLLQEALVPVKQLVESGRVDWRRDPNDWFDFRLQDSFAIRRENLVEETENGWVLPVPDNDRQGLFVTFEFNEQMTGFPYFVIDAPEGTIVELFPQESHDPISGPAWLDSHFFAWSRFVCREGLNRFETFDYESCRWLQLHIRQAHRPVTVKEVGLRRRLFPWPVNPGIECDDPALQRLFEATLNTVYNAALETFVDGMGRERQQYSGDCGPQLFVARYALGDALLARRYLRTFSEGQSPDGYFMDCWPAFDRLARVMQKQIDGAYWGPLLDHGVGFNFDCWWHYLDTGDLDGVQEPFPRLLRFAEYLESVLDAHGLLPVENLGIPAVWIDHDAFKQQKHKQCAFNLYAAAMFKNALAPLCAAMNLPDKTRHFTQVGDQLLQATIARYWNGERGRFEANLPWQAEEGQVRLCDRSLATSILYDQCPEGNAKAALQALVECPPEMGLSYPANAYWRYWALAKLDRADVIVKDWRERWATMPSVLLNNSLQEMWTVTADGTKEWSHCPVSPIYVLFTDIAGIRPAEPGFSKCTIRPQLTGLGRLHLVFNTVKGPIPFTAEPEQSGHRVVIALPEGCEAELQLPGENAARLEAGKTHTFFCAQAS